MTTPSKEQIIFNKVIDSGEYNISNASIGMCIALIRCTGPFDIISSDECVIATEAIDHYMRNTLSAPAGYLRSSLRFAGYGHYSNEMLIDFYRNWDKRPMERKPNFLVRLYRALFK